MLFHYNPMPLQVRTPSHTLIDYVVSAAVIEYPPAIMALQHAKSRKEKCKKRREAHIEDMPKDALRRTRLHQAALRGERKWFRYLCRISTDEELFLSDIFGKTPLHYAAQKGLLNESLYKRGVILTLLLQIQDTQGDTPLHIMAKAKKFDRSVFLDADFLDIALLLQARNVDGLSVLDIIKNNGDQSLLDFLALKNKQSS